MPDPSTDPEEVAITTQGFDVRVDSVIYSENGDSLYYAPVNT